MGTIQHDAVIVVVWDTGNLPDISKFRSTLPERWQPLVVGPVSSVVNFMSMYAFLPDGSKEGWRDSDDGDTFREQFRAFFDNNAQIASVSFGEMEPSLTLGP